MMLLAALLSVQAFASAQQTLQQPLASETDLISALKRAEIIPTVLDTFKPKLTVSLTWKNATAEVGNTIDPSEAQEAPQVSLVDHAPAFAIQAESKKHPQLTLALTDPDAPSRQNPEWSQICHWILTNVPLQNSHERVAPPLHQKPKKPTEIMPYKPPGPPPKTGKHRYVFVAMAPANGTTKALALTKPGGRRHWGFGAAGEGLREWMGENGLVAVGANFLYAQNAEQ